MFKTPKELKKDVIHFLAQAVRNLKDEGYDTSWTFERGVQSLRSCPRTSEVDFYNKNFQGLTPPPT